MTQQAAEKIILKGDRFADQAAYLDAVRCYTDAYLGIVAQLRGQEFREDVDPKLHDSE